MNYSDLYLVRHGESMGNVDNTLYETVLDADIPLTQRGKDQSKEAARSLQNLIDTSGYVGSGGHIDFYVSPYKRAKDTLVGVQSGINENITTRTIEDPRLREHEYRGKVIGSFDYDQVREFKEQGRFWYRFDGGESIADCYDRSCNFLQDRIKKVSSLPNYRPSVIVSHGTTIRCLMMRLLNWDVETFMKYHTPDNGSIIHLKHNPYSFGQDDWVWVSGKMRSRKK